MVKFVDGTQALAMKMFNYSIFGLPEVMLNKYLSMSVTGGFNFSNCWTSAWAAANAILKQQRIGKANVR